jgi:hypothetical protein
MSRGYVYILTNDSMPGLVKVGRTTRPVDVRAAELWQTGVPSRFEVYWSFATPDCVQLEAYVHADMRRHRLTKSREFFSVEPEFATERARFWAHVQAQDWMEESFEEFTAVHASDAAASYAVQRLADELNVSRADVAEAISCISAKEVLPALRRAHELRSKDDGKDMFGGGHE